MRNTDKIDEKKIENKTNKKNIRQALRQQRLALPASEIKRASLAVSTQLSSLPLFQQAKKIAGYLAFQNEIDPLYALERFQEKGGNIFMPVLNIHQPGHLLFAPFLKSTPLIRNIFGILEPKPEAHLPACLSPLVAKLDIILVPLIGFNSDNYRLGQGGGYYDRLLAIYREQRKKGEQTPVSIGLAYGFQYVDPLPIDTHDMPLDYIITDTHIIKNASTLSQ